MDESPFLEFNILELKESELVEVQKFHKSYFDIESIVNTASELKYSSAIKKILNSEFKTPTANFVKFFVSQVYDGRATEGVMIQFTEIVKKSINHLISDMISERLKTALNQEASTDEKEAAKIADSLEPSENVKDDNKEITEEEMEGYLIVKSILRQKFNVSRIIGRDTKAYFGILLDDNNRKPLARLWFNGGKKYLGIFDIEKNETKLDVQSVDDIYKYADQLIISVSHYEKEDK